MKKYLFKYLSNTMLALFISVITCFNGYGQTKQDTVKCIMVVCDTSHIIGRYYEIDTFLHYKEIKEDYGFSDNKLLYWQIGYDVRINPVTSIYTNMGWLDESEHIEYLDADKKPLNKNIIVWQSKSL